MNSKLCVFVCVCVRVCVCQSGEEGDEEGSCGQ